MAIKEKQVLEMAITILNDAYGCPTIMHITQPCDNDCMSCWKQHLTELVEDNNEN